jgi:hypothetical protein
MKTNDRRRLVTMLRPLLLFLILLGLTTPALAEPISRIHYQAWDAGVDVNLAERTLVRGEVHYEYASEVSGNPSGSSSVNHPTLKITPEQVEALRAFVEECGFMDLEEAYGAPADERYYPYEITVYLKGGETRSVLFRSNPGYDDAPEAFQKLEDYLNDLTGSSTSED